MRAELLEGKQIATVEGEADVPIEIPVENPRLWYPNGYGSQPL